MAADSKRRGARLEMYAPSFYYNADDAVSSSSLRMHANAAEQAEPPMRPLSAGELRQLARSRRPLYTFEY